jgi:DNA polymerase III epsilon subunit-like protein
MLVEVATVTLVDGLPAEQWSSLVRPGRPIPPDATRVHGISDAMVETAPEPAAVAHELRARCADHPLVFHNADFDLPFVLAALRAAGEPPLLNLIIDVLGLARGIYGVGDNRLERVAERLGLKPTGAHRALDDALTTARAVAALAEIYERERGVRSLTELSLVGRDVIRATRR